jgi:molybdopterin converting factor small subunit
MANGRVVVWLPGALLRLFPGASGRVDLAAATVSEVMDGLDSRWPGMRARLVDETPAVRRHISVFVDGNRLALDAPLQPGAEVFILTAISGG